MENEEVITFLKNQQNDIKGWVDQVKGYAKESALRAIEAYDIAIKSLKQPSYEEIISRIEQARDKDKNCGEYPYNRCIRIIEEYMGRSEMKCGDD